MTTSKELASDFISKVKQAELSEEFFLFFTYNVIEHSYNHMFENSLKYGNFKISKFIIDNYIEEEEIVSCYDISQSLGTLFGMEDDTLLKYFLSNKKIASDIISKRVSNLSYSILINKEYAFRNVKILESCNINCSFLFSDSIYYNCLDVTEYLLERHPDRVINDYEMNNLKRHQKEMALILLKHGGDINCLPRTFIDKGLIRRIDSMKKLSTLTPLLLDSCPIIRWYAEKKLKQL